MIRVVLLFYSHDLTRSRVWRKGLLMSCSKVLRIGLRRLRLGCGKAPQFCGAWSRGWRTVRPLMRTCRRYGGSESADRCGLQLIRLLGCLETLSLPALVIGLLTLRIESFMRLILRLIVRKRKRFDTTCSNGEPDHYCMDLTPTGCV